MALRKSTMVKQVAEAVARDLPGEQPVATVGVLRGGSPYRYALIGVFDNNDCFVTLTDRSLAFHDVDPIRVRPQGLAHRVPLPDVARRLVPLRRGLLWSHFGFVLPGDRNATRLNVCRAWYPELNRLLDALA
ncbi:hypothetical protein AB0D10_31875 [Kitasatospora sp. NPDC048545]|uniref:hypothetical protein n=1 Tax=Kitasatospora sp. NPDC048545 TaxID=3157208 RepID=UPI0034078406